MCYDLSGVCKSKPPPLPKGRKPGPAFEVIDPKEAEMEKMLAGMKVLGFLLLLQHGMANPYTMLLSLHVLNEVI